MKPVAEREPFVRYTFGEFSINFSVILRVREITSQFHVVHEFIKRLQARYRAGGIVIPLPVRRVILPDD